MIIFKDCSIKTESQSRNKEDHIDQFQNKKRKGFSGKYEVQDQKHLDLKKLKETVSNEGKCKKNIRLFEKQEVRTKIAQLNDFAQQYQVLPDEILDLFYFCSMNISFLSQYLQGNRLLKWNEDEDSLLKSGSGPATRVLCRYKTEKNVYARLEFLKKCDLLDKQRPI